MKKLEINPDNGAVILPSGVQVFPSLLPDELRRSENFDKSGFRAYGIYPWKHFAFSGGNVCGRVLLVDICFFNRTLELMKLTVDFYSEGAKDWSDYSLDTETNTKRFHDAILEEMLGKPSRVERLPGINIDAAHEPLAYLLKWDFGWGTVISSHDNKGGGTYMIVRYGNHPKIDKLNPR